MDAMTRWLSDDELASWLKFAGVLFRLNPALDSQLQRDSDMTLFDYLCLAMLSEQEDHTRRMSDLAARTNATLSRLSHVITKLERRGWVRRSPSPESGRVTLVTMTDLGHQMLVEAAPGHVETVRALVYDGLEAGDVEDLRRIMTVILGRLEDSQLKTRC